MTETAPPIDSFGIALPPEWVRFPLADGDFDEFVKLQRNRLAAEAKLSRTAQRQFEIIMRQLRNDCERASVTLAAILNVTVQPDDLAANGVDAEDAAGLLAATCTISSLSQASLGSDLPLTVNTIAAAMARQPETDDEVEIANLEPPARIEIPAGPAVKLVRLHTFPPHPETRQRLAIFAHHVLVPYDAGRRAAVITFSTPNPEYAKPLSGLFDEMVSTFRMFGGDDVTDPLS